MSMNNVIPGDLAAEIFAMDESVPAKPAPTDDQKNLLREWVADLRSGEFEQTTGQLCRLDDDGNPVGHCCLGVLEERAIKNGLIEAEIVDNARYGERGYRKRGTDEDDHEHALMSSMPHDEIFELIGGIKRVTATVQQERWLDDEDDFVNETVTEKIAFEGLNDEHGWSFGQIADAIEAAYLTDAG